MKEPLQRFEDGDWPVKINVRSPIKKSPPAQKGRNIDT